MKNNFQFPRDITFNTGKIAVPASFARANAAASWLYQSGEEFASMESGMSFNQVAEAVGPSVNVASDPP